MSAPLKTIVQNKTQAVTSAAALGMAAGALAAHDLTTAAGFAGLAILCPVVTFVDKKLSG